MESCGRRTGRGNRARTRRRSARGNDLRRSAARYRRDRTDPDQADRRALARRALRRSCLRQSGYFRSSARATSMNVLSAGERESGWVVEEQAGDLGGVRGEDHAQLAALEVIRNPVLQDVDEPDAREREPARISSELLVVIGPRTGTRQVFLARSSSRPRACRSVSSARRCSRAAAGRRASAECRGARGTREPLRPRAASCP